MIFHKKSNVVLNSIVFIIVLFSVSIISLFIWKAWSDLSPYIREDIDSIEAEGIIDEVDNRYPSVIDGLVLFIFMGMWIFGMAASYFSESHPFLFGIMFIAVVFVIIAGAMLGNFYEELFEDEDISTITSDFPKIHWIMTHMLLIGIVIASSMALIYFGRSTG